MRDSWMILSLVGLVTLSVMTVLISYLVRKGMPTVFVLFVLFVVVAVILGAQIVLTGVKPGHISAYFWVLLITIGILSAIGNLALFKAAAASPNPGLVISVIGAQGAVVALLAVIFLKDKINPVQLIGIVLSIVAIVIIGLGSRATKTTGKINPEAVPIIVDKIT